MRRVLAAFTAAVITIGSGGVAVAQEEEGERIEALMSQAMDEMTAGAQAIERAKVLQGAESERVRAEGSSLYDQALAKYGQALELLGALAIPEESKDRVRQIIHYNTACARSMQGRVDEALTALGQALDTGFDDFDHIGKDTDLDPIRNEARFAQLIERKRSALAEETRRAAAESLSEGALFAYDFTITTLDGQRLSLADLRGKVVIVDYWGTWCPPCRAEIPHFVQLKQELGDRLAIVGMTWEHGQGGAETLAKVRQFAQQNGITYPLTLITDRNDLQKVPDLQGFPTTLFIDKSGRVRAKEVGYRDLEVIRGLLTALDAEPAPTTPAPTAPAPNGGGSLGPF
jgi:thiol-disulfide isomerase/thioredoxin